MLGFHHICVLEKNGWNKFLSQIYEDILFVSQIES